MNEVVSHAFQIDERIVQHRIVGLAGVTSLLHGELLVEGVAVTVNLAPELPSIKGQRFQLQQALLNLIVNGCDAMTDVSRDKREFFLTTELNDDESVLVCITDRGPGISPAARERVFDAFFTTKSDGLGLGLSVSRLIISSHGGRSGFGAEQAGPDPAF